MALRNEIVKYLAENLGKLSVEKRGNGHVITSEKYPFEVYLSVSDTFRKEMLSGMGIGQKTRYYLDSDFVIDGDFEVGNAHLSVSYYKGDPEMLIPGMPEIVKGELEKAGFNVDVNDVYLFEFEKISGRKSVDPEYADENVKFLKDLTENIRRVYKEECEKTRISFEKK